MGWKSPYRLISLFIAALSLICGVTALFVTSSPRDVELSAAEVSKSAQRRLDLLDSYSDEILFSAPNDRKWVDLRDFPKDMVIYCYIADTLQSWYNLFTVNNDDISPKSLYPCITDYSTRISSPLAAASYQPSFVNLGSRWYLLKMRKNGNTKVIEGVVVKDSARENISRGRTGVNRKFHIRRNYDAVSLNSDVGAPVFVDGNPVFKLAELGNIDSEGVNLPGFILRWASILLMTLAVVLWLAFAPGLKTLAAAIVMLLGLMCVSRLFEANLTDFSQFFSPALYAHGGLLDSFATVCIISFYSFLTALCVFLSRNVITEWAASNRVRRVSAVTLLALASVWIVLFTSYTLDSLIRNSGISLDILRIGGVGPYTVLAYLSFAVLLVCVLLYVDTAMSVAGKGKEYSCRGKLGRLIFAVLSSLLLLVISLSVGTEREEGMMAGWSNRLALDRDMGMEMHLRRIEGEIEADPVISTLCHTENTRHIAVRRLEEMYLVNLTQDYDISVRMLSSDEIARTTEFMDLSANASPVGPHSHFLYSYDQSSGSRYIGLFSYYDKNSGMVNMLVEISPKYSRTDGAMPFASRIDGPNSLPSFYSYAKYNGSSLVSFSGDYAYPTILEGILNVGYSHVHSFSSNGYRHFMNRVNDDEVVVISRRERGWMTYFVNYSYLLILMSLIALIFRKKETDTLYGNVSHYFSTRMRRLIEISLLATMLTIVTVSVVFVIRRNDRNLTGNMARKISSIQIMLDGECRQMDSYEDMRSPRFIDALEKISSSANTDISIYTPSGRLFLGNTPDMSQRRSSISRIDPEAFRHIRLGHQRYFISRKRATRQFQYMLYAPIFNNKSSVIGIVAAPYLEKDSYFTLDAVLHSSMMFSLFLMLLVVTVMIASSITDALFKPLLAISHKMQGVSPDEMEQIEYDGDDEISALVDSYNKMVVNLKESTRKLASAERDKAWSGMARQVAHEIKNPLTPIKLEIQRLMRLRQKNDPSWTEKFDEAAEVVLEHIEILSQTANEFSTFAKLYTEEPVSIDLDKTLRDQILLFSNESAEITYLGSDGAVITGPKPQLIRVFVNLLTNAVQAVSCQQEQRILVSLRRGVSSETWDIVFEDNGPGVPLENQQLLFTPNFTTKSGGTGLGLAICRSIVDKCGGSVAYSKSFNLGGACFTVTLPEQ